MITRNRDTYSADRMVAALEDQLVKLHEELKEVKKEYKEYIDKNSRVLSNIRSINHYDEQVQKIISSHPAMSEMWDNFQVQYQLTANEELLLTANEKIAGKRKGKCYGCGTVL